MGVCLGGELARGTCSVKGGDTFDGWVTHCLVRWWRIIGWGTVLGNFSYDVRFEEVKKKASGEVSIRFWTRILHVRL